MRDGQASAAIDSDLGRVAEKVRASERLSFDDGLALYRTPDIHTLGELANLVRERLHGRTNYTNYCVLSCRFCSFARPYPKAGSADTDDGYELSVEEIVEQARSADAAGATEVHIVGGLHPKWPFEHYLQMCRQIHDVCPRLHIKAFTAVEIIHFTRVSRPRLSMREVLERLREAGLGSLPGGGAEIFDQRVHNEAFKNKVGEAHWFDVHRTAHELGVYSNATMLYGHVETPQERLGHLIKLREHQDASVSGRAAHFQCAVPLPFIPEGSALAHLPGPTGLDDLRTLAITRLMLDNVPHVKAFWIMQTPKLAQVSLNWGADDIDGTVVFYDITRREGGGTTHQELSVEHLRRLIVEAGGIPAERDTLYRRVIRENGYWRVNP